MTLYTRSGDLSPTPPFSFEQSLDFLGLFPPTQAEQSLTARILTKAVTIDEQPVVFRVKATGSVEAPCLAYTLFAGQPIDDKIQRVAIDRISFFLSLTDDLRPFYDLGRQDAMFAPIIKKLYGYHQVKFLTPFENACWAVLTQRTPLGVARKAKQALIKHFNLGLDVEGVRYQAFPEAAQVAQLSVEKLTALVSHQQKADYLLGVAKAFTNVSEEFLRTAPRAEVEAWLRAIKGIGMWSAEFILIRGLGRMDQAAFSEKRLMAAINQVYGNGKTIDYETAQRIAERYGAYQDYWAHYLRAAN